MKKTLMLLCLLVALVLIVPALSTANLTGHSAQAAPPSLSPTPIARTESILSKPTITAIHIEAILVAYHSPAAGLSQFIYDAGVRSGIDPVHVLAIFLHESRMGTTGEAIKTFSPGNERCVADRPCIDLQLGGYAQMQSWQDGFTHLYTLLLYGYVRGQVTIPLVGHVCTTVDQIVPVFAPSADHNDVEAYIAAWEHTVDVWRSGEVMV